MLLVPLTFLPAWRKNSHKSRLFLLLALVKIFGCRKRLNAQDLELSIASNYPGETSPSNVAKKKTLKVACSAYGRSKLTFNKKSVNFFSIHVTEEQYNAFIRSIGFQDLIYWFHRNINRWQSKLYSHFSKSIIKCELRMIASMGFCISIERFRGKEMRGEGNKYRSLKLLQSERKIERK